MKTIALFALLAAAGCPPSPSPDAGPPIVLADSPPPAPPAPASSACAAACTVLSQVGCPEGAVSTCAARLQAINDLHTQPNPGKGNAALQCADLTGVTTAVQARSNGIACDPGKAGMGNRDK